MKNKFIVTLSACIFYLLMWSSCQNNTISKEAEKKIDSLDIKTQQQMDSAEDAYLKKINSVSDTDIINDEDAPDHK